MAVRLISWFWNRFRPQEGWLPFFLLLTAVAFLIAAVLEVDWVPETAVVIPAAFWGLMMGTVLAKRPLRSLVAWSFIAIYGLLLNSLWLGRLVPPLGRWFAGWPPFSQYIRQNSAVLFDRMAGWFKAVFSGGSSQETIIFAFGLGLAAWFLAAFAAWRVYRQRQILPTMMTIGVVLAINNYYGRANLYWIFLYVGLATLATAVFHLENLEQSWQKKQVDYSDQIRLDLLVQASAIGLVLLTMSMSLPSFSLTKLARAFQNQPAVQQVEETLNRAFGGVRQPRGSVPAPDGVGGSGLMPRSYLLGNPPELSETVVMTAVIKLPDNAPTSLINSQFPKNNHWRALSYNIYTGRGWTLSEERQEDLPANTPIALPFTAAQLEIQQTVHWVFDQRLTRYTLGQPRQFDQPTIVAWRGLIDLVRVQRANDESNQYQVTSFISTATEDQLRQTGLGETFNAGLPPIIQARYTELPDSIPDRVLELAQEVASNQPTAYDQARTLERFLRQYPYSLDVELPPSDNDPVDFFLFDLQSGYCDYYSSAMAVMARSLGLPARIGVGFLAQPSDANGVQTIYQINGHSWTEIYFPDYGWIEFEPTAAFPSPHDATASTVIESGEVIEPDSPPVIPPPAPQEPIWRRLWRGWNEILLVVTLTIGYWIWQRWQKKVAGRDSVVWAYGRLQHHADKLGQPHHTSQTPDEFTAVLLTHLDTYTKNHRLEPLISRVRPPIEKLNSLFVRRRYGRAAGGTNAAQQSWQQIRWPLWLLRLVKKTLR